MTQQVKVLAMKAEISVSNSWNPQKDGGKELTPQKLSSDLPTQAVTRAPPYA